MAHSHPVIDIEQVLNEVKEFLPRLAEGCKSLGAEFANAAVTEQVWAYFGELVQGIDDLYRTMQLIARHMIESEDHYTLLPTIQSFISVLAETFETLNRLVDAEQYKAAGDILNSDLVVLLQKLTRQLRGSNESNKLRYEANMNFLREKFPHVHHAVEQAATDTTSLQIVQTLHGLSNLELFDSEGKAFLFYDENDPIGESIEWAESLSVSLEGKSNIMVYGFGLGYHLERLANNKKRQRIFIYEPDPRIFLAAMHAVDLEGILNNDNIRYLAVGEDRKTIDQYFYHILAQMKGETASVSIPVYDRIDKGTKKLFREYANSAIRNFATDQAFYHKLGMQMTSNILTNLAVTLDTPSILGLKGKLKGIAAVIVGAGPSLEEDIEVLREMKNHALIIAAGTSVQSLLHYGITPHLIVSMDGFEYNFKSFSHLNVDGIPFLYVPQIECRIIENMSGNLMHAFLDNDIITKTVMGITPDDPVFLSTHSVTGTAVQAAIFMGCEQVVFTGQDLSYPTELAYAAGAKQFEEKDHQYVRSIATLSVENVNGGYNRTTETMMLTLENVEYLLEEFQSVRFTNTSKIGAKIKNTVHLPLREVLNEVAGFELEPDFFKDLMRDNLSEYDRDRNSAAISRVQEMRDFIEEMDDRLARIQKNLKKLPELSRLKPNKCVESMLSVEADWEPISKSNLFQTLFMTALKVEINRFGSSVQEIANESNLIRKADMFCDLFSPTVQAMRECIPTFKELIEVTLKRINYRLRRAEVEN